MVHYSPGTPLYAERTKLSVKTDIMAPKNTLQVRLWFQKLAPSSKENSTPPVTTFVKYYLIYLHLVRPGCTTLGYRPANVWVYNMIRYHPASPKFLTGLDYISLRENKYMHLRISNLILL